LIIRRKKGQMKEGETIKGRRKGEEYEEEM